MNIAQKIAKESTITFSGHLYGNVNRYLYTALLARWVGVEYLGIYSLANSIILIAEVLAKMGLETGIMRFVSRLDPQPNKEHIQRIVSSALKMTSVLSVIVMAVIIFGSGWLVNSFLKEPPVLRTVLIVFALTMPFNAFTLVSAFATQGFKLMKYKVLTTQIVKPTVLFGVMVLSFWFISKEAALMLPMVVSGVLGSILIFKFLQTLSGVTVKSVLSAPFDKAMFTFSIPLMFVTILQTFMHWMDILMLGYFTDAATVGLYHPAARTAGLLQALLIAFISIYAPILSQLHSKGKVNEMSRICKLVSRWILTFAAPISLIFVLYPIKVMLLFGPDYMVSAPVLIILTYASFIQAVLSAPGAVLTMAGYTRLALWNSLGALVLNIIMNVILIPRYGIYGAAWATLISLTAIGLIRVIEVRWILKISFLSKNLLKPIFAGIVTCGVLIAVQPLVMGYHTLVTLSVVGLVSVFSFSVMLWIMKFEPEDRDFLAGLGVLKNAFKK